MLKVKRITEIKSPFAFCTVIGRAGLTYSSYIHQIGPYAIFREVDNVPISFKLAYWSPFGQKGSKVAILYLAVYIGPIQESHLSVSLKLQNAKQCIAINL